MNKFDLTPPPICETPRPRRRRMLAWVLALGLALAACGPAATPAPTATSVPTATALPPTATAVPPTATVEPLTLTSPAFGNQEKIPEKYVCHGDNVSPPLAWTTPPAGTQSLALVLDDPDAASVVGYVWDHWIIFNLPAESVGLPEKVADKPELPDGSLQGTNSFGHTAYGGPCPPGSAAHHYTFTLYALDATLGLKAGATKADVLKAMEGHILQQSQLVGLYP